MVTVEICKKSRPVEKRKMINSADLASLSGVHELDLEVSFVGVQI